MRRRATNGSTLALLKGAAMGFSNDDAMTLSAALAFYASLSLAPLVLLLIWVGGVLGQGAQERLLAQVQSYAGAQASAAIQLVVENAKTRPELRTLTGIVSIAATILAATGVFAQLQYAMNRIWNVEPKASGIKGWLRKRGLSLLMILIVGASLVASLALTAILSAAKSAGQGRFPEGEHFWMGVNLLVSLAVFAALFAAVFKFLPDTEIGWRSTWVGAIITSVLFIAGKWLVGLYLAHSTIGSAYGAAGSFLVLLVWVYYSAIIFFFGAEVTQVWARLHGRGIRPEHPQRNLVTA